MISLNLKSTAGVGTRNGVKILVYGRAGRGKTRLCATLPNPVIFSAESGLLSLASWNIPYYEIKKVADLKDAYAWCKGSHEARQFESVGIDSISEVAEVMLTHSKVGKKDPRQAYGEMIDEMTKVVRDFRDLPGKHVYMAVKQERIQNADGVIMNGPSMPGKKLGENMPYFPDEVFQIEIEGQGEGAYHYLRCKPNFSNDVKDRSGVLNEIEEPHLGKIIQKITHFTGG